MFGFPTRNRLLPSAGAEGSAKERKKQNDSKVHKHEGCRIASIRNYVRGSFDALTGPWVKGRNHLAVKAVAVDPFKTLLAAIVPVNNTEGAKPVINTVLDETTMVYDVITGTNVFSIAGAELALDTTKDDEYVALANALGFEPAERQGAPRVRAARRAVHAEGLHPQRPRRPVRRARRHEEGRGGVNMNSEGCQMAFAQTLVRPSGSASPNLPFASLRCISASAKASHRQTAPQTPKRTRLSLGG